MKILVLSDIHGNISMVEKIVETVNQIVDKVDLIIISGDITHFGGLDETLNILKVLNGLESERIFFIPGNCDSPALDKFKNDTQTFNIHMKVLEYLGYVFLGLGGSSKTPFNTLYEFTEETIEFMLNKLSLKIKDTSKLITVTHDPPYNTKIDVNKRGVHVGSRKIREFILNKKPVIHISGHIHESRGRDLLNKTILVNPGSASSGHYSFIEIKDAWVDVKFESVFK